MSASPLQLALAARKGNRTCEQCETISYQKAADLIGSTLPTSINTLTVAGGWDHLQDRAGLVRYCVDCLKFNKSQPWSWINDIDPEVFNDFVSANLTFNLIDLKPLLKVSEEINNP